jgi:16S rRNA (uracil1498-N3)-methyltransferase
MRDHRHFLFFSSDIRGDRLFLDQDESRHAVSVLRLTQGSLFCATDGLGSIFECRCEKVAKKNVIGSIVTRGIRPRHACSLHCMVGIPERTAFESLLVHGAALGVTRITPVVFKHCQSPWWDRSWETLASRFLFKMIAGIKQARYPWLPHLDAPVSAAHAFDKMNGLCLVADQEGIPFASAIPTVQKQVGPFILIVGPPGGLSTDESEALKTRGSLMVTIAPTRLTTDLAMAIFAGDIMAVYLTSQKPLPSRGAAA